MTVKVGGGLAIGFDIGGPSINNLSDSRDKQTKFTVARPVHQNGVGALELKATLSNRVD
jgi:hypothetical protein